MWEMPFFLMSRPVPARDVSGTGRVGDGMVPDPRSCARIEGEIR